MSKVLFANLGVQPIPNNFLSKEQLGDPEPFYPLSASFDTETFLVQLDYPLPREVIFNAGYPYFSSQSTTFLAHAQTFANEMIHRFNPKLVVEIGSNDGYLLQFFKRMGVRVFGYEPCLSVAAYARNKGITTIVDFFGSTKQIREPKADLMIANNVLAHVPDIDDFVDGFRVALAPEGVVTFEFPHLLNLIQQNQFDTIYHEHYSYLSLVAVTRVLDRHDLRVFDVEQLPVHGGSLRVFACLKDSKRATRYKNITVVIGLEHDAGLYKPAVYEGFAKRVCQTKRRLLDALIDIKAYGDTIVGYGAPAKGNTLLNYCGIGKDFLEFVVDTTPAKQGMYLPGSRLEIRRPLELDKFKPDYVLILPWNFKDEIMGKLDHIRNWGGKFIVPIPTPEIIK